MQITYKNTIEDLAAFQRYYYSRSPGIFLLLFFLAIGPVVGTVVMSIQEGSGTDLFSQPSYYIILIIVELLLIYILMRPRVSYVQKYNPDFFLEHQLELTAEGIRIKDVNSEFFRKWEALARVNESKSYFFIFVQKRAAIILPKHAFSSSDEIELFRNMVELYLKK